MLQRQKVKKEVSSVIKEGLLTFSVANSVFLICSFLFGVIRGDSVISVLITSTDGLELTALYQPDFVLFHLSSLHFQILVGSFTDGQALISLGALAIGWVVAGIFVRLYYPSKGYTPILSGSLTMSIILSILVWGLIFLPLFISFLFYSFGVGSGTVLFLFILIIATIVAMIVFVLYTVLLCIVSIPGYVLIAFTQQNRGFAETVLTSSTSFLSPNWARLDLNVLPQSQSTQNLSNKCPFKDENLNGCSFLGYQLPKKKVICDSPNTFRRCKSYKYLYARRLEIITEFGSEQ